MERRNFLKAIGQAAVVAALPTSLVVAAEAPATSESMIHYDTYEPPVILPSEARHLVQQLNEILKGYLNERLFEYNSEENFVFQIEGKGMKCNAILRIEGTRMRIHLMSVPRT